MARVTGKQLEQALRACNGIQARAAAQLGVHRSTVSRRVQASEKLQAVSCEAREALADEAEDQLWRLVQEGNVAACIFVCKTLGRERGFTSRVEQTGPWGGPIAYLDSVRHADAELRKFEDQLEARGEQAPRFGAPPAPSDPPRPPPTRERPPIAADRPPQPEPQPEPEPEPPSQRGRAAHGLERPSRHEQGEPPGQLTDDGGGRSRWNW